MQTIKEVGEIRLSTISEEEFEESTTNVQRQRWRKEKTRILLG
jgi:hypothetical protein